MSHVVKVAVTMRQETPLLEAAKFLGLEHLGRKVHELFGGQKAEGHGFRLPGWNYPVVVNPETGEAHYDNYGESWGKQIELDKLCQRYTEEAVAEQALLSGYSLASEQTLENGDRELEYAQLVSA